VSRADFEAAARASVANATLVGPRPDDFADKRFHRQTDAWVLSYERRQRTADATNDEGAVASA
jgi:hypothetical protein